MVEYGPAQRCTGKRNWRIVVADDETGHREKVDDNMKDDQLEYETNWQGEKDKEKHSRHATTINEQSIWVVAN